MDLNFDLAPATGGSENRIDIHVGFNLPYMLTDKVELDLVGNIGGFGVASDFT